MTKYVLSEKVAYNAEMNGAYFVGDETAEEMYKFTDHNKDIIELLIENKSFAEIKKELDDKYEFEGDDLDSYMKSFVETLIKMGILCEES